MAGRRSLLLRAAVIAGFATGLAVMSGAPAADAHADIESTEPANGAVLAESPPIVSMYFTEPVEVSGEGPEVFDASHGKMATSGYELVDGGAQIDLSLPPLADGSYVVTWRAVSGDGHPISGAFTFSVGSPDADIEHLAESVQSPDANRAVDVTYAILRAIVFAGALVAIGRFAFVAFLAPDRGDVVRPVIVFALLAFGLGSAAEVLVIGPYMSGGGLGDAFAQLDESLASAAGRAAAARGLLAAIGMLLVWFPGREPITRVAVGAWSVAAIATFSLVGHPRTGRWQTLAVVTDAVHLAGASFWIGGLVIVLVLLRSGAAVEPVRRFSRLAAVLVAAVVVTGTIQGFRQMEELDRVFETTYGRVLVAKVVLVGCILLLGARSRAITQRRLDHDTGPSALRRVVLTETTLAVVVIALTAVLVNTSPPRAAIATSVATEPLVSTVSEAGLEFTVSLTPGRTGPNALEITVVDEAGEAVDLFEISARLHPVDASIAPLPIELVGDNGTYRAETVAVPFPATYMLEITALTGPVDQVEAETEITIP